MERHALLALIIFITAACSQREMRECAAPPLEVVEVERIGRAYLDGQDIGVAFRQSAETRVVEVGCNYEYTEAEKLDSFGIAYVVKIDRRGNVLDFYGEY